MAVGPGKSWARGRSASTDPRIARAAAGHRGLRYERRTPLEQCKWPNVVRRTAVHKWSPAMAYAVGLIATDGCLLERPAQIAFVSQDRQLIDTLHLCLGREIRFRTELTKLGRMIYRVQFKDIGLYRWLEAAGLTPRKSLTLGALAVPGELLAHLVRGLLDGDGSIVNGTWRADMTRRPDRFYYYEFFRVQFASASHATWTGSGRGCR